MMIQRYIYDIAIYWQQQEEFNANYHEALAKFLDKSKKFTDFPLSVQLVHLLTDRFWKRYVAPWNFNQVVGWIRLYVPGSQVCGELWFTNAKRFGRNLVRKQFSLHRKLFDLDVRSSQSSDDIFFGLLSELRSINKIGNRRIYLELEPFETLGPFIDWRSLTLNRENDCR